jgi:hypothetical protein
LYNIKNIFWFTQAQTDSTEHCFDIQFDTKIFMAKAGFLDFDLFSYPTARNGESRLQGSGQRGILIVLAASAAQEEANLHFLENILKAAQLSPAAVNTYRLDLEPGNTLTLAACCREHHISDVILFGDWCTQLGIRAKLPAYHFTRLGEVYYLLAHDLEQLRTEREQGQSKHAGALWQALKTRYL